MPHGADGHHSQGTNSSEKIETYVQKSITSVIKTKIKHELIRISIYRPLLTVKLDRV